MKPHSPLVVVGIITFFSLFPCSLRAANGTWTGAVDGSWTNTGNWAAGVVPGAVNSGTNTDSATFNNNTNTTITIDNQRSLSGILFTGAGTGTFTIGTNSNQLHLVASGGGGAAKVEIASDVTNSQTIAAPISLRNTGSFSFLNNATVSSATLNFTGSAINMGAASLKLGGSNTGNNLISSTISASVNLYKDGTGKWILNGNNTYGGTTFINAGTLVIGNGGTTGNLPGNVSFGTTSDKILAFNRSDAYIYGGNITGSVAAKGTVEQIGAGVLTLTGNNTYAGGTQITVGTLVVGHTNALGVGNVAVYNNGKLNLNGTTSQALTLGSNAAISIDFGTIVLSYDLGAGTFDQITGSGASSLFTLTDNATVDLSNSAWDYGQTYAIFSGFASGSVGNVQFTNYDSTNWTASLSNAGVLSFAAIPEPGVSGLVLGGGTLLAFALGRRRRAGNK